MHIIYDIKHFLQDLHIIYTLPHCSAYQSSKKKRKFVWIFFAILLPI